MQFLFLLEAIRQYNLANYNSKQRKKFPIELQVLAPAFLPAADMVPELSSGLSALIDRMLAYETAARPDYPEIVAVFRRESEGRGLSLRDRLKRIFH